MYALCFVHAKNYFSHGKTYSLGGGGGPKHVLHDLLEVADVLGARTVEVLLDERTHRSESVLQPSLAPLQGKKQPINTCIFRLTPINNLLTKLTSLAPLQGPSLVVHIPGVALATEDILRLMSLNWDVRGKTREDATHRQRVSRVFQSSNLNLVLVCFSGTNQSKFK